MTTTKKDPHAPMVARLRRLRRSLDLANARVRALEDRRTALYLEARQLDPPMTYMAIAKAFGVTEAAVMQKVSRAAAAEAKASG